MRVTAGQLDNAFVRYVRAAEAIGFDVTGWQLSHGSRTQGNPYKLGVKGDCGANLPGAAAYAGDIGKTRAEAFAALEAMAGTLEDSRKMLGTVNRPQSGMVYAFMTASANELRGEGERNGWIDQQWSEIELHESRNDVRPLFKVNVTESEELREAVTDCLGDGSLWFNNGGGTFYGQFTNVRSGWEYSYAIHFVLKFYGANGWCERPWTPNEIGSIV